MKKYDVIVVGAGVSGLTLSVLLGLNGKKVLLIEKNPRIGGGLSRFYKNGIPFDPCFHFTGGFYKDGVLSDMLAVLGIKDYIQPVFLSREKAARLIFEKETAVFDIPLGIENCPAKIKQYFPDEKEAIEKYFEKVKFICKKTVSMDLRTISLSPEVLEEDYISLSDFLDRLTKNKLLKGLLSAYCMCHGVKPKEISFANHSRVAYGLYDSVSRVKDGGEAFLKGFRDRMSDLPIDIKCSSYITELKDIKQDYAGKFVLNDGEEIACQNCVFTIHPKEILKLLPKEHFKKAFFDRVNAFEPTLGFFSLFGVMQDNAPPEEFNKTIISMFPSADINEFFEPSYKGEQPLVILNNLETVKGQIYKVVNAFEASFVEHVSQWQDSTVGHRPAEYLKYKEQRTSSIKDRISKIYPEYNGSFKILDAASILTFRDYLNSYDGAAYGIKQKVGQYSLFGKLALRNIYAAGQSAVLPGLLGAMLSSFLIVRSLVGKEDYTRFIEKRLC